MSGPDFPIRPPGRPGASWRSAITKNVNVKALLQIDDTRNS